MLWDATALAELAKLGSEGKSQAACASILHCAKSAISHQLRPRPLKPKPEQSKKAAGLFHLQPRTLNSSCPMKRHITDEMRRAQRNARPQTKTEMYATLAAAVRNTARL